MDDFFGIIIARLAILLETNLVWQTAELMGSYSEHGHSLGERPFSSEFQLDHKTLRDNY